LNWNQAPTGIKQAGTHVRAKKAIAENCNNLKKLKDVKFKSASFNIYQHMKIYK
jgi:hypothetical protein